MSLNWLFSRLLRPLCWIGLHPLTSQCTNKCVRCDVCGRFVARKGD